MSRRKHRIRSLAWSLHELRSALTAIQLGLSTGGPDREAALLVQLDRARLALVDLDAYLGGKPGKRDTAELVDLEVLVLRATCAWSQLAPCYGARLRASWRAGGVRVRGHAGRLARALDNVISNAVEHGRGEVLVVGELVGNRVQIAVADEGPGVSASSRLREAPVRARHGHGLAITRAAVADCGGLLLFEQRQGRSAVVIELPVTELAAATAVHRTPKRVPVHRVA